MWAVQILFQRDFNQGDLTEAFETFWKGVKATSKLQAFTEGLVRGVELSRGEVDMLLQKAAANWEIHRMGAVDRNVMRVAIYEMLKCKDIPHAVSINEAVDLAKELSSDESGRFVNGVLDRARKELERAQAETASADSSSL